jgi:hypothetical protein
MASAPPPMPSWLDGQTPAAKRERAKKMEEIKMGVKRTTDGLRKARALEGFNLPDGERSSMAGNPPLLGSGTSSSSAVSLVQVPGSSSFAPPASPCTNEILPCEPVTLHP